MRLAYDPHARDRMTERVVTSAQVAEVLLGHETDLRATPSTCISRKGASLGPSLT